MLGSRLRTTAHRLRCRWVSGGPHGSPDHQQIALIRRAFRDHQYTAYGTFVAVTVGIGGLVFWKQDRLKEYMSKGTADVATRSLSQKEVLEQAHKISKEVVRQILTDKEVHAQAQRLALDLTYAVLQDDAIRTQVQTLLTRVFLDLLADPAVAAQFGSLVVWALQQPNTVDASLALVDKALRDPTVLKSASDLAFWVLQQPHVVQQAVDLGMFMATSVLQSPKSEQDLKLMLQDVLADTSVQQKGSEALWNVVVGSLWRKREHNDTSETPAFHP